jgi:hypothetical protein
MTAEVIPVDDILEVYGKLSIEKKAAVTNLARSRAYLLSCLIKKKRGYTSAFDWWADPTRAIYLLSEIISLGRNEFGKIWLDVLKKKISRME